jgi:hypothetical protein
VKPADILTKAKRALSSAQALLEMGDDDGAANRAYWRTSRNMAMYFP